MWEVVRMQEPTLLKTIPQGPLGDFSARQKGPLGDFSARKPASKLVSTLISFGFLLVIRVGDSSPWGKVGKSTKHAFSKCILALFQLKLFKEVSSVFIVCGGCMCWVGRSQWQACLCVHVCV